MTEVMESISSPGMTGNLQKTGESIVPKHKLAGYAVDIRECACTKRKPTAPRLRASRIYLAHYSMAIVAQLAEHLVVVQDVAGSSPVDRPFPHSPQWSRCWVLNDARLAD